MLLEYEGQHYSHTRTQCNFSCNFNSANCLKQKSMSFLSCTCKKTQTLNSLSFILLYILWHIKMYDKMYTGASTLGKSLSAHVIVMDAT